MIAVRRSHENYYLANARVAKLDETRIPPSPSACMFCVIIVNAIEMQRVSKRVKRARASERGRECEGRYGKIVVNELQQGVDKNKLF